MDKKKVDAQFVKEMPEKFDKGGTCHWLSKIIHILEQKRCMRCTESGHQDNLYKVPHL